MFFVFSWIVLVISCFILKVVFPPVSMCVLLPPVSLSLLIFCPNVSHLFLIVSPSLVYIVCVFPSLILHSNFRFLSEIPLHCLYPNCLQPYLLIHTFLVVWVLLTDNIGQNNHMLHSHKCNHIWGIIINQMWCLVVVTLSILVG